MNPVVTYSLMSLGCQSCHKNKRGYSYVCGFCQVPYCESCIKTYLLNNKKFDDSKVQYLYKWKSEGNERLRHFRGRRTWNDFNNPSKKSLKESESSEEDFATSFSEKEMNMVEERIRRANPRRKFNRTQFRKDNGDKMYKFFMQALTTTEKILDAIEKADNNKQEFDTSAYNSQYVDGQYYSTPPDYYSSAMSDTSYYSDPSTNYNNYNNYNNSNSYYTPTPTYNDYSSGGGGGGCGGGCGA